ncbi:DNA-binding transcriptional LysR family regulator [Nocardia tenerifensis]|uniref:DNA-binding transcriptional LysR family regulator n=1 Tax=Nocardia tenerifensis TaxID=228006 RepID=A0A318K0V0_9NOCA|nr:LysR family transcriptional regulator [Nocardia tenerifensis]PXX60415.1 DNA-binding transcriptional LysR family regulator [Nocardia tenerifensis]
MTATELPCSRADRSVGYGGPAIDLDIRQLPSFLVVARELNITRASARLHVSQQTLSTQIQQLERALGVTLLVRTSRGVLLAPAGLELERGGNAVTAELGELIDRVRATDRGRLKQLRVACFPYATALFAIEVADAMESAVPGLELTTVRTPPAERAPLLAGEVDAAFMWLPLGDARFGHVPVRSDARVVALPPGHRLADRESVTRADLADEPVIRPDIFLSEENLCHWVADPRPDGSAAPLGPVVEQVQDCLMLVARGKGVWLAPEPLSRWIPVSTLRWLPVIDAPRSDLALVWTADAPHALVARMIAEVREVTGWLDPAA